MRTISNRLLNKSVTISKMIQVANDSGDFSNTRVTVASNIKMRINLNKTDKSEYSNNESGKFAASTHKGFCDTGIDINIGYYVEDNSKIYSVDSIDYEPGGELNHHYEIGMTLIQPEQAENVQSPIYIGD